jgi:hypothetical protein
MNTKTAAAKANVTTATIRTWCRRNVIAATKTTRGWDIDETSLNHRITLGRKTPKTVAFTVETMTAIGGSRWTKGDMDRVYINNWADFAGLDVARYNTGNISSAAYQGESISNRQAGLILGAIDKVWFDAADGKLHARYGYGNPRMGREQVWDDVATGIRAAVAAL